MRIVGRLLIALSPILASLSFAGTGHVPSRPVYLISPVVFSGAVPSLDDALASGIGHVVSNERGQAVFTAWWRDQNSKQSDRIFLVSAGCVTTIATDDTPVPGIPWSRFLALAAVSMNNSGEVAIVADVGVQEFMYLRRTSGLFVYRNGGLSLLATRDYLYGASINDKGDIAFTDGTGLFLFSGSGLAEIVSRDQGFRYISNVSMNSMGQIAFAADDAVGRSGIFLCYQGAISTVVLKGQPAPEGGGNTFDLLTFSGPDDSGAILFPGDKADDVIVGAFRPQTFTRFGLYLYSDGTNVPVVLKGQALLGLDAPVSGIGPSSLSHSGIIAVSLGTDPLGPVRDFLLWDGILTPASYYLAGDPPANAAQLTETLHFPLASDTATLEGMIPDRAAEFRPALFAAFPVAADSIPPDDFETLGANNLPSGWPTFWTDSPGGGVDLYNSYGTDSFSGDNVLRLHVGSDGGSTFILSDPIDVQADRFYAVTAQMRYYLTSPSDATCFTLLQLDSAGKEIAINEADGIAGDNYWGWRPKALCIHTLPDTATIRIRFGLIASKEAYLDVDALR